MKDPVKKVLKQCLPENLKNRMSAEMNEKFMKDRATDLEAVFIGAKLMAKLNPKQADAAIKVVTNMDVSLCNRNIKTCNSILASLQNGEFGSEGIAAAPGYKAVCGKVFIYTAAFQDSPTNHAYALIAAVEEIDINN